MSLTFLGRGLVFLVLAALAGLGGWTYGAPLARYMVAAQVSTTQDARVTGRALVYRLEAGRPLDFVFSQPVDLMKILAQPALVAAPDGTPAPAETEYGLRFRIFDIDGVEIGTYEQHLHSSDANAMLDDGSYRRFYRNRAERIGAQDQILIEDNVDVGRVEVSLIEADPSIAGIDIRVYERRPAAASEARSIFLRRSSEEQGALAAANAFPPDMLTEDEIRHIAVNLWRPVGPVGIDGHDYDALVVYEAIANEEGEAP
ncbi:hypothetical protein [Qipengyuania zhejiangensis]|uniref:hypothetical protein n=1 Tax=Qipengyuania zhejiangensis TaxID=3077782 RepID=UPI002D7990E8|nr:hypothetical protein [Qipengyuania sp. Z2]